MHTFNFDLLKIKNFYFLFGVSFFLLILNYITQISFSGEQIYFNTYADKLSTERIQSLYQNSKKWEWLGYFLLPLFYLFKIICVTFCLTTASLLNVEKGNFKANFNVSLKADYIFIIMMLVRFIWLKSFKEINNLTDLGYIPGSILNLFNIENIPKWIIYPLQICNIWEVLYCLIGTSMYSIQFGVSKKVAACQFCIPYLIGLFIWVLVVVFLTLQFT